MSRVALVQLVSEQTMQNVLPILRLKPIKVYHLATTKTAPRTEYILKAVKNAGQTPAAENIRLSSMPSIAETQRAVARAIAFAREEELEPVVNFTGGTKLMSIGAFTAANQATPPAMSLYVDTDDEQFVDGCTAPGLIRLLENDMSFTPIRPMLTLDVIATANGIERITKGRDWSQFAELAKYLFANPAAEHATHDAVSALVSKISGNGPRSPEEWLKLLDCEFELPEQVAHLAAACGLVRITSTGKLTLPDGTRHELEQLARARANKEHVQNYDQHRVAATEPIAFALGFLSGGWWEVVVADAVARTGLFTDVRWGATVVLPGGSELEEDVVCVDGVRAVCISCKRGGAGARLIAHLEELDARARNLGGQFTRKFVAVYVPVRGTAGTALVKRARELNVRLITPENIARPDGFTRAMERA
ncbi:MAG: DUF1887 family CARF protein [Verrucomicrobiae bacterium]|nr:DUF1887 family CARF protein [Verrucomicrobiae bacterium]